MPRYWAGARLGIGATIWKVDNTMLLNGPPLCALPFAISHSVHGDGRMGFDGVASGGRNKDGCRKTGTAAAPQPLIDETRSSFMPFVADHLDLTA